MSRFTKADLEVACEQLGFTMEKAPPIKMPGFGKRKWNYYPGHWVIRSPKEDNVGKNKGYIFAHVSFSGSSGGDFKLIMEPKIVRTLKSAERWRRNKWHFDGLLEYLLHLNTWWKK